MVSASNSVSIHEEPNEDEGCSSENNKIPFIGMVFDNVEEAYACYNNYGGIVGFSIKIFAKGVNKAGMLTSRVFACSKEGTRKPDKRDHLTKNPRAETRTGCGALMGVRLDKLSGKYKVYKFVAEHNHDGVKLHLAHFLPSQRKISATQSAQIELADDCGIVLRESYELMGREVGGRDCVGFLKLDQKNYLRTKRQRDLAFGEVGCILKYFQLKTTENESFYYAFQLDSEEKITNIFWADAEMIVDYGHFGDAVSFDTTYKTNRDCRPFGIFLGFNHHREVSIFGAALMYDETAESFIWLFETFLHAMSNKLPKTIFTDQDAAMAKALKQVMPGTFHRLCKWHIMQNALKNLHHCFTGGQGVIRKVFGRFFNEPDEEDDWLEEWEKMLDEYDVKQNNWLKTMFRMREKWAWPYVRQYWSAGMQSTQLSESSNASLKVFVRSDYGFSQFFTHFESFLEEKRYKECESDYSLSYRLPKHRFSKNRWLQHAGRIFTKRIFEELNEEFEKSIDIFIEDVKKEGEYQYFIISPPLECNISYQVTNGENDILSCNCKLFDMRGILCCHMIKVLKEVLCNLEIPEIFILKRWTKAARSENVLDIHGRIVDVDPKRERTLRCKTLNCLYRKISSRSSETKETYQMALKEGEKLLNSVEAVLQSVQLNDGDAHDEAGSNIVEVNEQVGRAKGIAKRDITGPRGRRRVIGSFEKNMQKKAKNLQVTHESVSSQPLPIPQHDTQNQVFNQTRPQNQLQCWPQYQLQYQPQYQSYFQPEDEPQLIIGQPNSGDLYQTTLPFNQTQTRGSASTHGNQAFDLNLDDLGSNNLNSDFF